MKLLLIVLCLSVTLVASSNKTDEDIPDPDRHLKVLRLIGTNDPCRSYVVDYQLPRNNLPGGMITTFNAYRCCRACLATEECDMWTFYKDYNRCFLKKRGAEKPLFFPLKGARSGLKKVVAKAN